MSTYRPLNQRVLTWPFLLLAMFGAIALVLIAVRFYAGLGAVTNINDGYPWGIWVIYDVMIGTAFATGGWVLAFTVYILNKGHYHPLVRPALLASLFGYSLGAISAIVDMGRYWNFYQMFNPAQQNFNSVMLEVGLCVAAYCLVLVIEFLPVLFDHFKAKRWQARLDKVLFVFIALGILLPTMHQSSLGSLAIAMGMKIDILWQSMELLPVFALLSALTMGFSIVIFESSLVSTGLRQPRETHLLRGLGQAILGLLAVFLILRVIDLTNRNAWEAAFAFDLRSWMFWIETALFVTPIVILSSARFRQSGGALLAAAVAMLFGGALYRLNLYLIGFHPGGGYVYFPSVPELLVTTGIIALEILAYLWVVKKLPVLHSPQKQRRLSGLGEH